MKALGALALAAALAACATVEEDAGRDRIVLTPDDAAHPRVVRFEVPSVLLFGIAGGDGPPVTLRARVAAREIAAQELAHAGYCPRGFSGPEGIHFPGGDRSRSVFVVRCEG